MVSSNGNLNRREFLKSAGVAAAGVLAVPWAGGWLPSAPVLAAPTLRVGAAIPTYLKDRRLAKHWLKGLRFGLTPTGATLIPYTADDRVLSVSGTLKDLIQVARADLIVGSVSPFVSTRIAEALAGTSAVFLNAEVGANLMLPSLVRENVFHHTLHYWQANWAAGAWAAQNLGRRGVILATFYESGYDALAAFQIAFEKEGGEILRTIITHSPTETWNAQETLARAAAAKPDFVYLMASGTEAVELQSAYQNSPLFGHVPMTGTGFAMPGGSRSVSLDVFARDFRTTTGETPNAIALLGYETGLLIHRAQRTMAQSGVSLAEALSDVSLDGPRGAIGMDAETHATTTASFVDGEANLLAHLPAVEAHAAWLHPNWSDTRTGWMTPYFGL